MFNKLSRFFSRKKSENDSILSRGGEISAGTTAPGKPMPGGEPTLQDFMNQMKIVGRMGALSKMMKHLPGVPKEAFSPEAIAMAKKESELFQGIFAVMSDSERQSPAKLNAQSKQKIARKAGVAVADVDLFFTRFEQTRQFAKLFGNKGLPR